MATLGLSDELEQAEQATAEATLKSTKSHWRKGGPAEDRITQRILKSYAYEREFESAAGKR